MEKKNEKFSNQEMQELFRKYSETKDITLRNEIVERNRSLVRSIARSCHYSGIEFDDLENEGCIGLIRAVEKFDYKLGYRFSTYAVHWILRSIQRYIEDNGGTIRIPVHAQEKLARIKKFINEYQNENGYEPETSEIAAQFGMSESDVVFYMSSQNKVTSLQKTIGDELELEDVIVDDEITLEESFENTERDNTVLKAVNTFLTDKEKFVITKRFGLFDSNVMTLTEVGAALGMTGEGVRRIQVRALRKLRSGLENWGYGNRYAA